jgi:hypothetical protein
MFDDYYAFTDIKDKEYLVSKGKEDFDDIKEANVVLQKSLKGIPSKKSGAADSQQMHFH